MSLLMIPVFIAAAAIGLYLLWKFRWGPPDRTLPVVLTYHKITGFEFGGTWMTPARFTSGLDHLADSGYSFIGEDEFIETLDGRRESHGKEILITFDDGYRMLMDDALPYLAARNIPALIFLVTSYAGRENSWELSLPGRRALHLGWDEISDLSSNPLFTFGSHSRSHRDLTRLSCDQLADELSISREVIGHHTGRMARSVSYPFGLVDRKVEDAARSAGYETGFTLFPAGRSGGVDRFSLRREGVWIIDTKGTIDLKLSCGRWFWFEDIKGRTINRFAAITPFFMKKGPFD
jgi:peptidoglycan/xylan/chitin deacetylase (PgdA/CDA1 family)